MRQTHHSFTIFVADRDHLDARWKLIALGIAVFSIALIQTATAAFAGLLTALLLARLVRVPTRWLFHRLLIVALFLAAFTVWLPFSFPDQGFVGSIGPVRISSHGVMIAVRLWCKALAIVTSVLTFAASTPFPTVVQAAHAIHIPGIFIQLIALTHRYAFLLGDELARLRVALRIRGYRNRANLQSYRTIGHVAGILLIRGIERSERVSQAMRCRGFDGRFRSSNRFQTRTLDIVVFLGTVLPMAGILAWDIRQR